MTKIEFCYSDHLDQENRVIEVESKNKAESQVN